MSLNKLVLVASACGSAVAVQPRGHFMALTQTKAECSDHLYDGPSADDYKKMCADLDADCARAQAELDAKHAALEAEIKAECEKQKRILAGKEDTHADEKAHVKVEDVDVSQSKKDVSQATTYVNELAHCRPELVNAKQELAQEEATPNDSSEDIDNECKAKKLVMEKLACVEKLEAAEAVLAKEKAEHKEEEAEHREESHEENQAAAALPPQEEKVRIACAESAGPAPKANCRNQEKKDALLRQADQAIEDLLAEYLRQKKILEGKQDDHAGEKADVNEQEDVVAEERKDVKDAKEVVARDAHCPPELEKAEAELSKQQGIPNDTEEDVDAECVAQKAVLEAQACVDRLRKAERVLATQQDQHSNEKSDLRSEQSEEDAAAAKLPPQEKIVCELKAALDAARAARKALPCGSGSEEPAPAPAPEPEKKSGATRATALAAFAALLCALVQA